MIYKQNYKKSSNIFAKIDLYFKHKKKSASLKSNYDNLGFKHLAFNKGLLQNVKQPKVAVVAGGGKRNKVPLTLKKCPKTRRPVDGKCPDKFPFFRKKNNGQECCFTKPTHTTGIVKTHNGKIYVNGKQVNTLSYNQLMKAAKSFDKKLLPKMKRKNLINALKSNT